MEKGLMIVVLFCLTACGQPAHETSVLQKQVDSLSHALAATYKPGLGDFMSSIQIHHNKLWFAGQNQNWKLADFEIHEITEALDDIQKYLPERSESRMTRLLRPVLDSVADAVRLHDVHLFTNRYTSLTNTCNTCHRATSFEGTIIKIPDQPPFSNQQFKN